MISFKKEISEKIKIKKLLKICRVKDTIRKERQQKFLTTIRNRVRQKMMRINHQSNLSKQREERLSKMMKKKRKRKKAHRDHRDQLKNYPKRDQMRMRIW